MPHGRWPYCMVAPRVDRQLRHKEQGAAPASAVRSRCVGLRPIGRSVEFAAERPARGGRRVLGPRWAPDRDPLRLAGRGARRVRARRRTARPLRTDQARDRGAARPAEPSRRPARRRHGCVGGALYADGAWWCGAAEGRVVVVCEPQVGKRLLERLRAHEPPPGGDRRPRPLIRLGGDRVARPQRRKGAPRARRLRRHPGIRVASRRSRRGPSPGSTGSGCSSPTAARSRSSPMRPPATAWRAIEQAGRPFGISCVGIEAARRYALLERGRHPATLIG